MTTGHMMRLPDGVRTISGTGDGDKQLFFLSVSSCFGCWGEEGSEDVRWLTGCVAIGDEGEEPGPKYPRCWFTYGCWTKMLRGRFELILRIFTGRRGCRGEFIWGWFTLGFPLLRRPVAGDSTRFISSLFELTGGWKYKSEQFVKNCSNADFYYSRSSATTESQTQSSNLFWRYWLSVEPNQHSKIKKKSVSSLAF